MKSHLSLAASAAIALASLGSLGGAAGDLAARVIKPVENSAGQSQPAKPTKSAPGDTKTDRLRSGFWSRPKAPVGKRLRQSMAQNRRVAKKKRNVKRTNK